MKNEKQKKIQDVGLLQQKSERRMSNTNRTTPQLNKSDGTIRYFSMFSGVGGFELGFGRVTEELCKDDKSIPNTNESNGRGRRTYTCIGFSEIDKYSSELLKQKFPTIKNYGDATKIDPHQLPEFDMLCGGFPCQAFSLAGKRRGFKDTRGTLFFDIARIVEVKRPKIILLENVKGLLNHEKGKTFRTIIQTISELGYEVQWMVLNSKFFGVPQNRERVFIVASIRGEPRPEILPFRQISSEVTKVREQVSSTICAGYYKTPRDQTYINQKEGKEEWLMQLNQPTISVENVEKISPLKKMPMSVVQPAQLVNLNRGKKPYDPNNREMKIKVREDETSYTVKSATHEFMVAVHNMQPRNPNRPALTKICPCGSKKLYQNCHGVPAGSGHLSRADTSYCLDGANTNAVEFNNMKIRKLTPVECCRLQGFPDDWTEGFSDTQRYKMMGNAVTVNVVKAIAERLEL